jgi:site-specific DNA-methyltransferase (cytosine-N4-specific)
MEKFADGIQIIVGDSKEVLKRIPDNSVQSCITSPPYWGLRDYDVNNQVGAESSLEDYIQNLVKIFREVRRLLTPDGTLWLNLGDSYTSGGRTWRAPDKKNPGRKMDYRPPTPEGLKPKDLVGVPWRVALALQADGWYLRSDIVWHKPNCQPESVKDRPTRSHEYVFLFSKEENYYYNHELAKESAVNGQLRNRRTVWSINTEGFKGAHFAVFPPELVKTCLMAVHRPGSTILDPFLGSGTVALVCKELGLNCLGVELNPDYAKLAEERLTSTLRNESLFQIANTKRPTGVNRTK